MDEGKGFGAGSFSLVLYQQTLYAWMPRVGFGNGYVRQVRYIWRFNKIMNHFRDGW